MNYYDMNEALFNTFYRSKRGEGHIQEAYKRDDVWVNNGTAYSVRVRPFYDGTIVKSDFWATIAVLNG